MDNNFHVRRGWLKAMYLYTLIAAGGTGLGMVFFPDVMHSTLGLPVQDPVVFKLYGSVLLASGLAAIPALRSPLKFVPLLLLQLIYKPIWLAVVAVPMFLKGQFPIICGDVQRDLPHLHHRGPDRHPVLVSVFQGIDRLRQTAC